MKDTNKYLTKEDMKDYIGGALIDLKKVIWFLEFKDWFAVVQRVGKCEPKKCHSACCKFCSAAYITNYSKGFFKKDEFGCYIAKLKCNNLNKDGSCKKWGKNLPNPCKQFPHPNDSIYWNVMDKCSFKFKVLYDTEIMCNIQTARSEMIKCFEAQSVIG